MGPEENPLNFILYYKLILSLHQLFHLHPCTMEKSLDLNFIELFCGSGTLTKTFNSAGWQTFSVDMRRRRGICEPTLKADVTKLSKASFPFDKINVVWASIPCTAFSYAAGNWYYHKKQPNPEALKFIKLLNKSLGLIRDLCPDVYFIENPRGQLRYEKSIHDFLVDTGGMIKNTSLGAYGFPTTKPTDIFTNALDLNLRRSLPFGRGAKCAQVFSNMTVVKRQATPQDLANEILQYCNQKYAGDKYASVNYQALNI